MSDPIRIRAAQRSDVALLLSMITELADYERAADQVTGTEELLEAALFDQRSTAEAAIADLAGTPVGFVAVLPDVLDVAVPARPVCGGPICLG